jgi:4-amino-4-deoxy-L-arabinose transferase
LSFITKGPPGLVPLLVILIFVVFRKKDLGPLKRQWPWGAMIFLIFGCGWYFLVMWQTGHLAQDFLWDEVVLRILSDKHQRNQEWYKAISVYLPVLLFGTLPWSVSLARGAVAWIKSLRYFRPTLGAAQADRSFFLKVWILLPLCLFALAKSRLPLYILPLFPALALVVARRLEETGFDWALRRGRLVAWCVLMLIMRLLMAFVPTDADARAHAKIIRSLYPGKISEIVFIDRPAVSGFRFYLDAEVERIVFEREEIFEEFDEPSEGGFLWIIKEEQNKDFFERIPKDDVKIRLVGRYVWDEKNYIIYEKMLS